MKVRRKLIPAVALLLISVLMLSTASYAWFSMNTEVQAGSLQITATVENPYLVISKTIDGEYSTFADINENEPQPLNLVTPLNLKNEDVDRLYAGSTDINDYAGSMKAAAKYNELQDALANATAKKKAVTDVEEAIGAENLGAASEKYNSFMEYAESEELKDKAARGQLVAADSEEYVIINQHAQLLIAQAAYNALGFTVEQAATNLNNAKAAAQAVDVPAAETLVGQKQGAVDIAKAAIAGEETEEEAINAAISEAEVLYNSFKDDPANEELKDKGLAGELVEADGVADYEKINNYAKYANALKELENAQKALTIAKNAVKTIKATDKFNGADSILWGTQSSSNPDEVQKDRVPYIVKDNEIGDYVYSHTLYFKVLNALNAENLKLANVKVLQPDDTALPNDDAQGRNSYNDLIEALRVLVVTGEGENVKYQIWSQANDVEGDTYLFTTVDKTPAEEEKVTVYYFFDGTDDASFTTNAQLLGNLKVSLVFTAE